MCRDFGHAPFWYAKITLMIILRNDENDLALCKVGVILKAGLFMIIKESNEDCLRLVAII